MFKVAVEPNRCSNVTAPVSAVARFSPAYLSRNLAMTRWMMRSTGARNSGNLLEYIGSSILCLPNLQYIVLVEYGAVRRAADYDVSPISIF